MIRFLLKGIWRDRARSLFPFLAVTVGVFLTVGLHGWMSGILDGMIRDSARFETGHLKVVTRAYWAEATQSPNELALLGVGELLPELRKDYPGLLWLPRIKFGGLIDVPDEAGETRDQGAVFGFAVDLFSPASPEWGIWGLRRAVVRGRAPEKPGEILLSDELAQKLKVEPGDVATLITSTMNGSMSLHNFTVSGTLRFGVSALDRGALVADLADIRDALDMEDAAGEIFGYFPDFLYRDAEAERIAEAFNARRSAAHDEFAPLMISLMKQPGIHETLRLFSGWVWVIFAIFIAAMSLVLWNAGLIGGLRRYGEMGLRLAIGEDKRHAYRSLLAEALLIGFFGSVTGTLAGLLVTYILQTKGIDISSLMKNASIMISNVMRARITPATYFIGFIPGLLATAIGAAISGRGIYKRQTSQLFKELEV
jgi:putative ABC transport system permease protein